MNRAVIPALESTLQKTHLWLKDLSEWMEWDDQHLAYLSLRAVLHALRDRLPIEVAAKFAAQLPLLVRGIYYEGWIPAQTPIKIHQVEDFFFLVASYFGSDILIPRVEVITTNVFKLIKKNMTQGEVDHLKKVLPKPIGSLWDS